MGVTNFPNGLSVGTSLEATGPLTASGGMTINSRNNIGSVEFTVGAEAANSINVAIQLKDGAGDDMAVANAVWFYLSDDAGGDGVTATAPDGDIAVGTDGAILAEATADKVFLILSEADGDIDLDIGEAAGGTWYLVAVLPDGHISVSDAITFAA